ncbi:MAG: ABC transporter ATP-binding protein [Pygmaiobacter massiliensis]|nr:ABC transporter ATP-binding protein [Pygmaiobacter massiliensis]
MGDAIRAEGLCKGYRGRTDTLWVLKSVTFSLPEGGFGTITGPSGSGKSTLLALLGCLDSPDGGKLTLLGQQVEKAGEKQLERMRAEQLGFVFQSYNLIPSLTARQNVELALRYRKVNAQNRRLLAQQALEQVGLADRAEHLPAQLSGGQQQRVSVARALAAKPKLLLADEPTGNLDAASARAVLDALVQLRLEGSAILIITHDPALAACAPLRWYLKEGKLFWA